MRDSHSTPSPSLPFSHLLPHYTLSPPAGAPHSAAAAELDARLCFFGGELPGSCGLLRAWLELLRREKEEVLGSSVGGCACFWVALPERGCLLVWRWDAVKLQSLGSWVVLIVLLRPRRRKVRFKIEVCWGFSCLWCRFRRREL